MSDRAKNAIWYTAMLLVIAVAFLLVATSVRAEYHGWDQDSPIAKWVKGLYQPNQESHDYLHSCCGLSDMYPIVIEQDAVGDTGDAMGVARIKDGSPITYPDGNSRPPLPTGMTFRFAKSQVNPLKDGNPTTTAWVFLYSYNGKIIRIYCVIPLPPGS